ncbi:MAG TPA: peptidyl-prolyl cis-trans isomerase [Candidatus Limnocylindria bacterium]|nr:peptidyl-prolyl cis-trans isomerase [Candidatus Limnocylindria bacterium]
MSSERWSTALLGIGALAGLALAAVQLVWRPEAATALPAETVATVNGVPITRAEFEQALAGVATDRREGLRASDGQRVLARLVDEELLLQRALALGLVRREARVRGQLVRTMIDTVLAEAGARDPDEAELRAFYDEHRSYFSQPGRLRVIHRAVPGTDAAAREQAVALAAALERGETPPAGNVVTAPEALLPPSKLAQYLGPTVLDTALALPVGGTSQPIASTGGYHVVRVVEREPESVPPFDVVRAAVRAEVVRRRGEAALREYLDRLRAEADVVIGEGDG